MVAPNSPCAAALMNHGSFRRTTSDQDYFRESIDLRGAGHPG